MNKFKELANIKSHEAKGHIHESKIYDFITSNSNERVRKSMETQSQKNEETLKILDVTEERLRESCKVMLETERDVVAKSKVAISNMKDYGHKVAVQMEKITTMLGSDFEPRLAQLERMVNALERLDSIQQSGNMRSVISELVLGDNTEIHPDNTDTPLRSTGGN